MKNKNRVYFVLLRMPKPKIMDMKEYFKRLYIIKKYKSKFKKGLLLPNTKEYLQYVDAVWKHKKLGKKYSAFQKVYDKYFKPASSQDARELEKRHDQVMIALKSNRKLELIPKGDFDKEVERRVQFQLNVALQKERESIRKEMESHLKKQLEKLAEKEKEVIANVKAKMEEERNGFYDKVLPFSEESLSDDASIFVSEEFQRLAAIEQQKKQKELDDLAKELGYQKRENELEGKKLALGSQKLSLESLHNEYAKRLLLLEVQEKELGLERRLMELTNIAATIQVERKDIDVQRRQIEVINLLADYELKTKEFDLLVTQKLLGIKEEGLNLKSDQIEHRMREVEVTLRQFETKMEIENKLLELKDTSFSQKAKEVIFEIEHNRQDVENKLEKVKMKEEGLGLLFREKNIELSTAHVQIAKKENELTLSKMELLEERSQLLRRLELTEFKLQQAQGNRKFLGSGGGKMNLWSLVGFLWRNSKKDWSFKLKF